MKMVKYVGAINEVIDEIQKVVEFFSKRKTIGKRELQRLTKCMGILNRLVMVIEKDQKPKPPRTLMNAIGYLKMIKVNGTYFAILDKNMHLIRTTLATKEQIIEPLSVQIAATPITLQMQKIIMKIPTIGFETTIPKKAKAFIQLVKTGKTIEQVKAK